MTPLEDDVRERFASIAAPDVAPPPTSLLRKRAHRIRTTRIVAAAASIAVVAAGIGIGSTTFLNQPQHAEFAAGVTAVRAHVPGLPAAARQWQVNTETVNGKRWVAASYLAGDNPCIGFSQSGGWCHTADNDTQLAEFATVAGPVVAVLGRVPLNARVVVVHLGSQSHTVSAVLTPTSNRMRFFAAFFPSDVGSGPDNALLGVFDGAGRPVPPPVPDEGPTIVRTRSHAPNLPAQQWSYGTIDGGYTAIAYEDSDAAACVAATNLSVSTGTANYSPRCAKAAPTSARILLAVRLQSGWTVLLGDAPTWVTGVLEWGPGGMSGAGTQRTPAASDRVFWAMSVPPGGGKVATSAPGNNVVTVVDLNKLLPHA